jgi:carbon-monoxide dehydrogenase large subunit
VGEGGVIGAVPSLTNAVADALAGLGLNVNSTPLAPDRFLALIRDAPRLTSPTWWPLPDAPDRCRGA